MTQPIAVNVTLRGRIFEGKAGATIKRAIYDEALVKINERMTRKGSQGSGGSGIGVKRNIISSKLRGDLNELLISSTRGGRAHWPRTQGTFWQRKNIAITKAMAPRVIRALAKRIEADL